MNAASLKLLSRRPPVILAGLVVVTVLASVRTSINRFGVVNTSSTLPVVVVPSLVTSVTCSPLRMV